LFLPSCDGRRAVDGPAVLHDLQPLRFLLVLFAGFANREQAKVIDYLREKNRVLRQHSASAGCGSRAKNALGSPPRPRRSVGSRRSSSRSRWRAPRSSAATSA